MIIKVKALQREQVRVQGLNFEFEKGEVKEIGPEQLARAVVRASDYLVEVEPERVVAGVDAGPDGDPVVVDADDIEADVLDVTRLPHGDLLAEAFDTVSDVQLASDDEILGVEGIGPARLAEIREALEGSA